MSSIDNTLFFKFCFISIFTLFGFYFLNDLDVDSQYFSNIHADEIAGNNNNDKKERNDFSYTVDSSEYFEEDNIPQNNNNNINNNNYNNYRNFGQLIQQQSEEEEKEKQEELRQQGPKDYNQMKKEGSSINNNNNDNNNGKKYEFTSIESKESNNKNFDKSDYVTFKVVLNLANIEKTGFIRLVGYINGQSFKEDISLSELDMSTNKLNVKLKVLKDTGLVSLDPPDESFACVYHVKDLNQEKNSILHFDCNEADVQSSDGTNTIRLFKPSSMVYSDSKALYDEQQQQGQGQQRDSKEHDKVLLKIISPLGDRKNTKELKIAVAIRGQIQTEMINNVQEELDKSKDNTITRTFIFDRETDLGNIQIGDRFHACVSSDDLNPPEGQECEKRLVKKFSSPNSLPAR
jgi:hypothetical protein